MIFISTIINSLPPGSRDLVEFVFFLAVGFLSSRSNCRFFRSIVMSSTQILPMFLMILSGTIMMTTLFVVMMDSMEA